MFSLTCLVLRLYLLLEKNWHSFSAFWQNPKWGVHFIVLNSIFWPWACCLLEVQEVLNHKGGGGREMQSHRGEQATPPSARAQLQPSRSLRDPGLTGHIASWPPPACIPVWVENPGIPQLQEEVAADTGLQADKNHEDYLLYKNTP